MNFDILKQHTVGREVWCAGVGLHSGAKVSIRLKPAPKGHGVRFQRVDVSGSPPIAAHSHRVVDSYLATSIGFDGVVISTIEHLMAALMGSRVDNVLVELNGPEVPIFDGSAARFLQLVREAGVLEQVAPRQTIRIEKTLIVRDGDAYIKATPSDTFQVRYGIDFPHPLVGRQELSWAYTERSFDLDISRARTFGFLRDVQKLQSMGLARGGSLENAIVFDDLNLLNAEGFRYRDECVRHKILDFMGDIALAGMPLIGRFEVHKAGHALHSRFIKKVLSEPGHSSIIVPSNKRAPFFSYGAQGFMAPVLEPI